MWPCFAVPAGYQASRLVEKLHIPFALVLASFANILFTWLQYSASAIIALMLVGFCSTFLFFYFFYTALLQGYFSVLMLLMKFFNLKKKSLCRTLVHVLAAAASTVALQLVCCVHFHSISFFLLKQN